MNALVTNRITQIVLLYNGSWWPDALKTIKTDLPIQKITYMPLFYENNSSEINKILNQTLNLPDKKMFMLIIESNNKYFDFWKELESTKLIVDRLKIFISRILSKSKNNIPNPEKYSIYQKGETFPDYSFKYFWKKNVDWCFVKEKMLKPLENDNIFIVNDSFDRVDNQGKYETLLQNSDHVLEKYFFNF